MMGINKERLFIFTGPKEDVTRYQKLFDHLKRQGNEVMVIEGVTEIPVFDIRMLLSVDGGPSDNTLMIFPSPRITPSGLER
jgi:type II secretory pathway component GspD/PulD (secretin)